MSAPIELTTPRLRLRQWRDSDRDSFAAMGTDPRVMEFLLPYADRAATDAWVERNRARIAEHGWGFWAVELRDTQDFIGVTGLLPQPDRFSFSPCVEIGWRIASAHWGRGYATEAARAALTFGFDRLDLSEIVAFTAKENHRSRSVILRLGMEPATPPTFDHPSVPFDNPLREHYLFRVTQKQWAQANSAHKP